jgi:predicted permease
MAGLLQDVRFSARQLRKSPGFSVAAILMLALGICANSTVFSWINSTLLHPVPGARNTGDLVTVMRGQWNLAPSPPLSYPDYRDLRETNHTLSGILAYHDDWMTLTGGDSAQRIYGAKASSNYFDVLGIKPVLGRFFLPDEESRAGGTPYLVLGYSLWQTRFNADPDILGKSVEINQLPFTIIGVAPDGFIGCKTGIRTDAWMPLAAYDQLTGNNAWLNVMARLSPGVNRARATQDLELLMRQLVAQYPNDHLGANTITLDPLWRSPFGANVYLAGSLPILLAIAGVVLLLTCANIATLALVRFISRRREIAIRQSLGANRLQLMRQMVLEGLLVSLGGGAMAILLTSWSSKTLARFIPPNANPIVLNGYVDNNVIAAVLLLALLASVICGALPAWRSSRVSAAEVLKEEAGGVSSGKHNRHLLSGLVVGQIALSLALLVTSGLFLRTLRNAVEANPGFEQEHVLTASVGLGTAGYSRDDIRAFQRKVLDQMQGMPGVTSASITDWLPLNFNRKTADAYPEGYVPQLHESMEVRRSDVSAGYFDTLSIPILQGRAFTRDDSETAPRVIVVDETAANRYWPRQNPIGRRLNAYGRWYTVVGVARNSKHQRVAEDPEPLVYFSLSQMGDTETILQLRTQGNPQLLAENIEQVVHQINARVPVFDVRPLKETTQIALMFQKMEALFASVFGLLALVLAASGIYGVVAYRTQLRTHEIGIRVALGASRSDVLRLVLLQGLRLTAIGLVLGLTLSFVLTRFLRGLLYGVSANDPFTVICGLAVLAAIAVLACYLPAQRAMCVDPVTAIREQ